MMTTKYKVNYKGIDFVIYRDGGGLDMIHVPFQNYLSDELFNRVVDKYESLGVKNAVIEAGGVIVKEYEEAA